MDAELMNQEVLCLFDIRQIQSFLFRVNNNDAVQGADAIVKHVLTDALNWAVERIDPPLTADQYDLNCEIMEGRIPWFLDDHIQIQIIDSVAGNAMVLFRTGALCQKVIHKVSRYLLEKCYCLDVATAAVRKTESLADDLTAIYGKMDIIKTDYPSSHPLMSLPVTQVEKNTGEPAVEMLPESGAVSKMSLIKSGASRGTSHFTDIVPCIGPGGKMYRAIMHLDGNNMGIIIGKLLQRAETYEDSIHMRRQMDYNIDNGFASLITRTMEWVRKNCFDSPVSEEEFSRYIYIVGQGGDDLNIIASPKLIIPFVEHFIEILPEFYIWKDDTVKTQMTVCAGIAFVGVDTPYLVGHRIAEECCDIAKQTAKYEENLIDGMAGNWIDFDFVLNDNQQSLEWKRDHDEVTAEGIRLTVRPYSFDDQQKDSPRYYHIFRDRVGKLEGLNLSKNMMDFLDDSYHMGRIEYEGLISMLTKEGYPLMESLGEPLVRMDRNHYAAWYDMLLLRHFIGKIHHSTEGVE